MLIEASRQPLFDGASARPAEGVASATVRSVRRTDSSITAMCSTIGQAAKCAVEQSNRGRLRRRTWRPNRWPVLPGAGPQKSTR